MSSEKKRMSVEDRREQILEAATEVFGAVGFGGGTTDAVARAAGISQAYVVRTFGSKEALVVAVTERACERIARAFRLVIAGFTGDETASDRERTMGLAYKALLADRGLMLSLMHAFAAGHDRVIGPVARDGFLRVYRIVRDEAGFEPVAAAAFMARGMLVDTLLALRITDMDDFDAMELSSCGFGVDHAHLVELRGLVGAASDFAVKR